MLDAVSSLPVVPSYDSEDGLGATFGRLADTLEELPGQLEATSVSLTDFTDDAGELQAELDRFVSETPTYGDLAHRSDGGGGAVVQLVRAGGTAPTVRSCRSN